ncbi:MAG: hypothetical protein WCJ61_00205 [Paludibacter sp.]
MTKYNLFFLALATIFMFSCIDEEGEGGTSIVQGTVYKVIHHDDIYSFNADTILAPKENVYIVYGNDAIYGDKMETGYDGFYRFKYLTKGTYKVYAYTTYPDLTKVPVIDTVTVTYGETKQVQNIYIHEGKSYETSYIKGIVKVKYYDKAFITGLIPANEVRVYIRVKGAAYHFNEIRTSSDGVFMFQHLSPGDYEVFVITEQAGEKILIPVIKPVSIIEKGVIVTIPETFEIIINA